MKRMMLCLGVALTICSPATAFINWECKTETGESVGIFEEKMVHVGINRDVTEYMCDGNVCVYSLFSDGRTHNLIWQIHYERNQDMPSGAFEILFYSSPGGVKYVTKTKDQIVLKDCRKTR